jgi:hypothetical protein
MGEMVHGKTRKPRSYSKRPVPILLLGEQWINSEPIQAGSKFIDSRALASPQLALELVNQGNDF